MKAQKGKISTRQLMLLFIMSTFSPAIRLFPPYTAKIAKQAGWLSPIVAFLGILILIFMIQSFFKKGKDVNLTDVICNILGKYIGRIVTAVYLVWIFILLALYVRYYAERIVTSIMPNTSVQFFIITMLLLVFFVVRGGIVSLARLNEILLLTFAIVFVITILLSFSNFHITNILPVSSKDLWPVAKASTAILAIWGYLFFMFFFADQVNDKEQIKRLGIRASVFLFIIATAIIAVTVGMMGYSLTSRIALPYFVTVKMISILGAIERLESIVLSIWIAVDFVLISTLVYISASIVKSLFKLSGTKSLVSPMIFMTYVLSLHISRNRFELETFSTYFALPTNVLLEFIVPIIIFITGKIRRVI